METRVDGAGHQGVGSDAVSRVLLRDPDRLAPLSQITAPALVVHGTEDPLRPLPHGRALAAQIPHARLEVVTGMGHGFFSPSLPRHVGQLILGHTVAFR